ncbi:MAG: hypothetical protein RLY93_16100 [Sumerlaeia bacterium]
MTQTQPVTVVSSGLPILYLYRSDQLALLPAMYRQVLVPVCVWNQLRALNGEGLNAPDPERLDWLTSGPVDLENAPPKPRHVGVNEWNTLRLARDRPNPLVLIEHRNARKQAQAMGMRCTGLLGMILMAKRKGLIGDVKSPIRKLQEQGGFLITEKAVRLALQMSGEAH